MSYHVFECIFKEPEEVKPAAVPSPPAETTEVPKKGTLFFLLFDVLSSVLSGSSLLNSFSPLHVRLEYILT